jgi:NAD(P)-dependent dehydrogenase (short-subunit alcohol dehydrogenase family)
METNFFGVLELTRALLPTLRSQRRGRIVIVSSEAAFSGQPGNAVYCASKWAIEGWAEAIAHELAPFGIEIILIEPGPYRTPIWENTARIRPAESASLFGSGMPHSRTTLLPCNSIVRYFTIHPLATQLQSKQARTSGDEYNQCTQT